MVMTARTVLVLEKATLSCYMGYTDHTSRSQGCVLLGKKTQNSW